MKKTGEPVEFGTCEEGACYQPRPGSYAVIIAERDAVAVIYSEDHGYCLPGGGAAAGESPEDALRREVLEECGHEVEILQSLGTAVEYLHAKGEGHFAKQCSFFHAALRERTSLNSEYALIWLPIEEAIEKLRQRSQSWAVSQVREASRRFRGRVLP